MFRHCQPNHHGQVIRAVMITSRDATDCASCRYTRTDHTNSLTTQRVVAVGWWGKKPVCPIRHTYIEYRGPKKAEGMDRMYIVTWLSLNNLYTQPFLDIFSILSPSVAFLTMLSAVSLVKEKKNPNFTIIKFIWVFWCFWNFI